MNLLLYNPSHINPAELAASFVDREHEIAQLHSLLAETNGPRQHAIIVGPRGMGKTALGHYFCEQVTADARLAQRWTPVLFFEESYGIADVADFWMAALRHLSDSVGESRWAEAAASLQNSEEDSDRLAVRALGEVLRFCADTNRGVILFVDNLQQVFQQFRDKRKELHSLRETLIKRNEIVLVGTANGAFPEISDRREPFYNFFKLIILKPFGAEETLQFVARRAALTNDEAIYNIVSKNPGRLEVIRRLTGGAPRWLTLACRLLSETPTGKIQADIERLVDEQTPYFKAQIDSLAPQLRRVFHVVAAHWAPMLSREVAAELRTTSSYASASLAQLRDAGFIEEIRLNNEKRARYQVRERLYNIYYISRFTRNQKQRLEALVQFIQQLFGPPAIEHIFRTALDRLRTHDLMDEHERNAFPIYARFFADDENISNKAALWKQALTLCPDARIGLAELIRLSPKIVESGGEELQSAIHKVISDEHVSSEELVTLASEIGAHGHYGEARSLLEKAVQNKPENPKTWHHLGVMCEMLGDYRQAINAFTELSGKDRGAHPAVHLALAYLRTGRRQDALAAIREADKRGLKSVGDQARAAGVFASLNDVARAEQIARNIQGDDFDDLGVVDALAYVMLRTGNINRALAILIKQLKSTPKSLMLWNRLIHAMTSGNQAVRLRDLARHHVDLDLKNVGAWRALAIAHQATGNREDADNLLRQALDNVPTSDALWTSQGDYLFGKGDYRKAAEAFRHATKLNPRNADAWHQLGVALELVEDLHEAEQVYRLYMTLPGHEADGLIHLAGILCAQGRAPEAIRLAQKATEVEPDLAFTWRALGRTHYENANYVEATIAVDEALSRNPDDFDAWRLKAQVHIKRLHFGDARSCLEKAIALGPLDAQNLAVCASGLWKVGDRSGRPVELIRAAIRLDDISTLVISTGFRIFCAARNWRDAFNLLEGWIRRDAESWKTLGVKYFLESLIGAIADGQASQVLQLLTEVPSGQFEPLAIAAKLELGMSVPVQPVEVRDAVTDLLDRIAKRRLHEQELVVQDKSAIGH